MVHGRLYDLIYGFPARGVYEREIQAIGTTNYLADAAKQHGAFYGSEACSRIRDTVHGELMTFDDPERRLITLDALEGYAPGEEGLYERVLVPVEIAGETVLAWTYRMERAAGAYLPGGRWPAK